MNESGNHHFQQTDTRTEKHTPHVLTHRQVLNNEAIWTQGGGASYTGVCCWGIGEGQQGGREVREGYYGEKCQI